MEGKYTRKEEVKENIYREDGNEDIFRMKGRRSQGEERERG